MTTDTYGKPVSTTASARPPSFTPPHLTLVVDDIASDTLQTDQPELHIEYEDGRGPAAGERPRAPSKQSGRAARGQGARPDVSALALQSAAEGAPRPPAPAVQGEVAEVPAGVSVEVAVSGAAATLATLHTTAAECDDETFFAVILPGNPPSFLLGSSQGSAPIRVIPIGKARPLAMDVLTSMADRAGARVNELPQAQPSRPELRRRRSISSRLEESPKGGAAVRCDVGQTRGLVRLMPDDRQADWDSPAAVLDSMRRAFAGPGAELSTEEAERWSVIAVANQVEIGFEVTLPAGVEREEMRQRLCRVRDAGRAAMENIGFCVRRR